MITAGYSYYLFKYEAPCGRSIEGIVYDKRRKAIKNYELSIEYIENMSDTINYNVRTNDEGYYKVFFKGNCRVRIFAPKIEPNIYYISCKKEINRKIRKDIFIKEEDNE